MSSPTLPTVKRLFAVSGNRCAFPRCPLPLVDEASGKVTGKICHIKAQSHGGPRYDPNQSEAERRAFENLLLLCPIHHDVIDSDVESYTVERLLKIKSEHEKANPSGYEPTDAIANIFLTNVSGGSLLLSQSQTGGQIANQINNFLSQPDVSAALEREIQVRRDTHDLEIFRQSDAILNEDQLERLFSDLLGDNSYRDSFYIAVVNFYEFFDKTSNQYLNSNLAEMCLQLSEAFKRLVAFLMYNFFVFPDNQTHEDTKLCLYPDLCLDRGWQVSHEDMVKYDEYVQQLFELVNKASNAYITYRKAVKETLFI